MTYFTQQHDGYWQTLLQYKELAPAIEDAERFSFVNKRPVRVLTAGGTQKHICEYLPEAPPTPPNETSGLGRLLFKFFAFVATAFVFGVLLSMPAFYFGHQMTKNRLKQLAADRQHGVNLVLDQASEDLVQLVRIIDSK